jgi:hypothetical protein
MYDDITEGAPNLLVVLGCGPIGSGRGQYIVAKAKRSMWF